MKSLLFAFFISILFGACQSVPEQYICMPCGLDCDTLVFDRPGTCPHCQMSLIEKPKQLSKTKMQQGTGSFLVSPKANTVQVHYYLPSDFSAHSNILMVIPGAGRDGYEYRDAWIEAAVANNILILSLTFPERDYHFEDYHMAGLIQHLNLEESIERVANTNQVALKEENLQYQIEPDTSKWLFNIFDYVFEQTVTHLGSSQTKYDLFGHSAGGQILHRMALFYPYSKANRIVAANAGFYTLPDTTLAMPFGKKGYPTSHQQWKAIFEQSLILLLGEKDNEQEDRGTLLRSPTADEQGLGRFARGQYFFRKGKEVAARDQLPFNWQLKTVPEVGHDFREMSNAAAALLYNN